MSKVAVKKIVSVLCKGVNQVKKLFCPSKNIKNLEY